MKVCHACRGTGAFSYPCKDCAGTGVYVTGQQCQTCRGTGRFYPLWDDMKPPTLKLGPVTIRSPKGYDIRVHRCIRCQGTGELPDRRDYAPKETSV